MHAQSECQWEGDVLSDSDLCADEIMTSSLRSRVPAPHSESLARRTTSGAAAKLPQFDEGLLHWSYSRARREACSAASSIRVVASDTQRGPGDTSLCRQLNGSARFALAGSLLMHLLASPR